MTQVVPGYAQQTPAEALARRLEDCQAQAAQLDRSCPRSVKTALSKCADDLKLVRARESLGLIENDLPVVNRRLTAELLRLEAYLGELSRQSEQLKSAEDLLTELQDNITRLQAAIQRLEIPASEPEVKSYRQKLVAHQKTARQIARDLGKIQVAKTDGRQIDALDERLTRLNQEITTLPDLQDLSTNYQKAVEEKRKKQLEDEYIHFASLDEVRELSKKTPDQIKFEILLFKIRALNPENRDLAPLRQKIANANPTELAELTERANEVLQYEKSRRFWGRFAQAYPKLAKLSQELVAEYAQLAAAYRQLAKSKDPELKNEAEAQYRLIVTDLIPQVREFKRSLGKTDKNIFDLYKDFATNHREIFNRSRKNLQDNQAADLNHQKAALEELVADSKREEKFSRAKDQLESLQQFDPKFKAQKLVTRLDDLQREAERQADGYQQLINYVGRSDFGPDDQYFENIRSNYLPNLQASWQRLDQQIERLAAELDRAMAQPKIVKAMQAAETQEPVLAEEDPAPAEEAFFKAIGKDEDREFLRSLQTDTRLEYTPEGRGRFEHRGLVADFTRGSERWQADLDAAQLSASGDNISAQALLRQLLPKARQEDGFYCLYLNAQHPDGVEALLDAADELATHGIRIKFASAVPEIQRLIEERAQRASRQSGYFSPPPPPPLNRLPDGNYNDDWSDDGEDWSDDEEPYSSNNQSITPPIPPQRMSR